MKSHILTAALLIAASVPLLADPDPAAQRILAAAEMESHIFGDQGDPLDLEVDFLAQLNVPVQGHLSVRWQSKNRWWSKVVMGDFQQVTLQNGERLYTLNNHPAPLRLRELTRLIHFAQAPGVLTAKKMKQSVANGLQLACLQVQREKAREESHELCVNPASHEIVSDAWHEPPDEQRREQFSDYVEFRGHRYPRKLQLEVNGSKVIAATVTSLKSTPLDPGLMTPPKGAVERRQCANMVHARPIKTPEPIYPKSAGNNRMTGDIPVGMTVLADGSVTDIQSLGGGTRSMDDATLSTLKTWKFKPAMCGSEPVVSDIEVVVSFRIKP